jgi:hypothetical protein
MRATLCRRKTTFSISRRKVPFDGSLWSTPSEFGRGHGSEHPGIRCAATRLTLRERLTAFGTRFEG